MSYPTIKSLFHDSIDHVCSNLSSFVVRPGKDLTRSRKIPAQQLLSFLVSMGSSSTRNELLDFWDMSPTAPSESALVQQRAKLKPQALEHLFRHFASSLSSIKEPHDYRYLTALPLPFLASPAFPGPSIWFVEAIPQKAITVSTSMPFMTWKNASIPTPSSSPSMTKMNSAPSAPLLTGILSPQAQKTSISETGGTALTTIWPM